MNRWTSDDHIICLGISNQVDQADGPTIGEQPGGVRAHGSGRQRNAACERWQALRTPRDFGSGPGPRQAAREAAPKRGPPAHHEVAPQPERGRCRSVGHGHGRGLGVKSDPHQRHDMEIGPRHRIEAERATGRLDVGGGNVRFGRPGSATAQQVVGEEERVRSERRRVDRTAAVHTEC